MTILAAAAAGDARARLGPRGARRLERGPRAAAAAPALKRPPAGDDRRLQGARPPGRGRRRHAQHAAARPDRDGPDHRHLRLARGGGGGRPRHDPCGPPRRHRRHGRGRGIPVLGPGRLHHGHHAAGRRRADRRRLLAPVGCPNLAVGASAVAASGLAGKLSCPPRPTRLSQGAPLGVRLRPDRWQARRVRCRRRPLRAPARRSGPRALLRRYRYGRQKRHMRAFMAVALGGADIYAGRDMRSAHARLDVTHDAFDRVVAHLVDTLASLGVPIEIIEAIGAKLAPLRAQIVTVDGSGSG